MVEQDDKRPLSGLEKYNLAAFVMAYACLVSSNTLVVGSMPLVVLSVGGSPRVAPAAQAVFFAGAAFVSLATSKLFRRLGRKRGFLVGTALGVLGSCLGVLAISVSSPALVLLSSFPLGFAFGIGMYLRFAAVEVVPPHHKAFAITLVLSGGCLAAFAGPETAEATRDLFGPDLTFLGAFLMTGLFNILNAVFISLVKMPPNHESEYEEKEDEASLICLLSCRRFLLAASVSTLAWSIMAMPMAIVRVAMADLGFRARASLWTIELHFLGMYAPGFVCARLMNRYGSTGVNALAVVMFCVASTLALVSSENSTVVTWILALVFIGVGWNFGFASATVLLTRVVHDGFSKPTVEAANDFIMFFLSGSFSFSTGYIYDAGGSGIAGWRTVNYVAIAMTVVLAILIVLEARWNNDNNETGKQATDVEKAVVQLEPQDSVKEAK